MLFSQRKGLKPAQKALQTNPMDDDLRYGLWSAVYEVILKDYKGPENPFGLDRLPRIVGVELGELSPSVLALLL